MLKFAAVGGFLTWYFYGELKNAFAEFCNWEPGVEYEDGVLSVGSLEKLLKIIKKNLKFELRGFVEEFIRVRKAASPEEYENIVAEYRDGLGKVKEKVILNTLKSFRLSREAFLRSVRSVNSEKVRNMLESLHNLKIVAKEISHGMDQLNTILMSKQYIDLMQESLNTSGKYSDRFKILDQLNSEFGLNELELYKAFKLHQNYLAVYEIEKAVSALELQFEVL